MDKIMVTKSATITLFYFYKAGKFDAGNQTEAQQNPEVLNSGSSMASLTFPGNRKRMHFQELGVKWSNSSTHCLIERQNP